MAGKIFQQQKYFPKSKTPQVSEQQESKMEQLLGMFPQSDSE